MLFSCIFATYTSISAHPLFFYKHKNKHKKMTPQQIFETMYAKDYFSQWLGVHLLHIAAGRCSLSMLVRKDMLNGFGVLHGGVSFALADSAFAFASNSHRRISVSIETSISHTVAVFEGDTLTATAEEQYLNHKLAIYYVTITNQHQQIVALFKGTVYRKTQEHTPLDETPPLPIKPH